MKNWFDSIKKKWHKSRTINFGLLVTILGGIQANIPSVQAAFTPMTYGVITAAVGMGIVVLRFLTTGAVEDK